MKWQNKVQLIGYLGKDPDINILPTGGYVATLRLATNDNISCEGKTRVTAWHRITVWGKRSDYIRNCFSTGSHVLVEGKLVYKSFVGKDGKERFFTEIQCHKLMNLDR